MTPLNASAGCAIALAGAGGSHPATIGAIAAALRLAEPDRRIVIFDMSLFDRRGAADYSCCDAEVIRLAPSDVGMADLFPTAGPNMLLSGGERCFRRMRSKFLELIENRHIRAVLLCHAWGYPEQALIAAANRSHVPIAQIDEGPFSLPIYGSSTGAGWGKRLVHRVATRLHFIPPRDHRGDGIDVFFCTSPGRRQKMLAAGIAADRLQLVGSPRYDRLAGIAQAWKDHRQKRTGSAQILWIHQPFLVDGKVAPDAVKTAENIIIDALRDVARRYPAKCVIRLHPRTPASEIARLRAMTAQLNDLTSLSIGTNLAEDMLASDMFVGFYSSLLLEAAACGAPVASSRLAPKAFRNRSEAMKVAELAKFDIPIAEGRTEMRTLILQGLSAGIMEANGRLLHDEIGSLDGRGGADVAARLIQIADSGRRAE